MFPCQYYPQRVERHVAEISAANVKRRSLFFTCQYSKADTTTCVELYTVASGTTVHSTGGTS
jgi:hypothetical protein